VWGAAAPAAGAAVPAAEALSAETYIPAAINKRQFIIGSVAKS